LLVPRPVPRVAARMAEFVEQEATELTERIRILLTSVASVPSCKKVFSVDPTPLGTSRSPYSMKASRPRESQFSFRPKGLLDQCLDESVPKPRGPQQFCPVPTIPSRPNDGMQLVRPRAVAAGNPGVAESVNKGGGGCHLSPEFKGRLILEFSPVSRPNDSVPSHRSRPAGGPVAGGAGDLSLLFKKGSPSPPGILFSSPAGIFPRRRAADRSASFPVCTRTVQPPGMLRTDAGRGQLSAWSTTY
jgi:hypothetical protein